MTKLKSSDKLKGRELPQDQESVEYFPTCDTLTSALGLADKSLSSNRKIAIKASVLRRLLTLALRSAPFDSETYVEQSPDIKKAFEKGTITDLKRHFEEVGYFEGRDAWSNNFDPRWYHSHYPDIAKNFDPEDIDGLLTHYRTNGQGELRAPNERALIEVNKWIKALKD